MTVPIVGKAAAGQPILAEQNTVGEVLVDSRVARSGRFFALELQGDSMIDARIQDQDLVVVREQPVAENGDIVVPLLDQNATIKRLFIRDERIQLRPENPKHRPKPIGPAPPVRRYEHPHSGDMLHFNINKLGRFRRAGHRVTHDRRHTSPGAGATRADQLGGRWSGGGVWRAETRLLRPHPLGAPLSLLPPSGCEAA